MKHPLNREADLEQVLEALRDSRHQKFLLCGHVRPDGDCIGSLTAVGMLLKAMGKETRVFFESLNQTNLMAIMPQDLRPLPTFPEEYEPDVSLCLDAADPERITQGFLQKKIGLVINIDHHVSNHSYGAINWIDPDAAAVGQMLVRMVDASGVEWTPEMASALYLAIATDTGGFRYDNTKTATFQSAARLVEKGASPAGIAMVAWGERDREEVLLSAEAISKVRFECDGKLAWSEITQAMYRAHGGEQHDPENLSGQLRAIKGVEVAALVRETAEGDARVSYRSRGRVNVSEMAARIGGGGHPAAAGAHVPAPYELGRERILEVAREAIGALEKSQA